MAVRKITLIGEDVLRREARKVKRFDKTLHRLIDDMVETMREAPGIGLAAPQVGVSQRVIVIELEEDEEDPQSGTLYEFVNPEIVYASEAELEGEEGCLSIPNIVGDVWRSQKVVVKGQNRFGKPQKIEAEEWLEGVHELCANLVMVAVGFHIAAVIWVTHTAKERLVPAMWDGMKPEKAPDEETH